LFCIFCLAFLHIVLAVPVNHDNPDTFEGDIGLDPYTRSIVNGDLAPNQAFKGTKGRIWAGGIIPYTFGPNFDDKRQKLMKQAMEVIEKKTCIRFQARNQENDYVHMVNENACWSMIGRSGGKQLLKMGDHCLQLGTAKHELMHTMGFYHEQSRMDRDNHVKILWENIRKDESYNFKKYNTNYYGQDYDLNSIMHYRKWEFSSNGRDTIQSISDSNLALGNIYFTERDLNAINAMYACPSNPTTVGETYNIKHSGGRCVSINSDNELYFSSKCDTKFKMTSDGKIIDENGSCYVGQTASYGSPIVKSACSVSGVAFTKTKSGSLKQISTGRCIHPDNGSPTPSEGTKLVLWGGCDEDRLKFTFVKVLSCRDLQTSCISSAVQGLCEHPHHIHSMSQNCKRACGKC